MSGLSGVFHELGDPTRLRVFLLLVDGRRNVSQIVSELELAQPQVSYHLKRLKDSGLAVEEKQGRWVFYEANWETGDADVRRLLDLVARWSGSSEGASRSGVGAGRPRRSGGSGVSRGERPRGGSHAGATASTARRGGDRSPADRSEAPAATIEHLEDDEGRPVVERPRKRDNDLDDFLL